jgi:hypothetical protein
VTGDSEGAQQRFQQSWASLCDLYFKIGDSRKERSIPGCTTKAEGLFGKEDLALHSMQEKVNNAGNKGFGKGRPRYSLPPLWYRELFFSFLSQIPGKIHKGISLGQGWLWQPVDPQGLWQPRTSQRWQRKVQRYPHSW